MGAPPIAVPAAIAAEQLRTAGIAGSGVDLEVDFAAPAGLPLPDETAVQAACGIMQVHGRAAGRPRGLPVDYASAVAGVLGAQGVLAAEIARARGARVAAVRTSVAQAALLSVQQYVAAAAAADPDDDPGEQGRGEQGRGEPDAGTPPPFTTADAVRVELETLRAEDWQRFWRALGAPDAAIARGWRPFQQRFGTATCPLPEPLHAAVRAHAFARVRAAAAEAGVSALPVRADPAHPDDGPAWRRSPLPGTAEPLPGAPDDAGAAVFRPLAGIRVVESTRRVQGPVAGQVLRMLGADVVRVEPPGGDPLRGVPPMAGEVSARFRALNDGKRVVELDIKSRAGRAELRELLSGAAVFVHNWAPDKAAELGLEAADLALPGLSYAWASGWDDRMGADPPLGTDFLAQAHSGLAAALADPPAPSLMTLTDVLGGLLCAQGVLAALLHRVRTGEGSRVDSSLLGAAGLVPRARTERDPLPTGDGFVAVPRDSALAERCRGAPTATWVERFGEAGLPATPVRTDLRELATGPDIPPPPWEFA